MICVLAVIGGCQIGSLGRSTYHQIISVLEASSGSPRFVLSLVNFLSFNMQTYLNFTPILVTPVFISQECSV